VPSSSSGRIPLPAGTAAAVSAVLAIWFPSLNSSNIEM
jgi:hypothetical protein